MIKMFADDAKTFAVCKSNEDIIRLQEDLESFDKWSKTWQIKSNAEKCNVLHIGNKNPHYECNMISDNYPVIHKSTECEKDLGVDIENQLNFRSHISTVSKKANS